MIMSYVMPFPILLTFNFLLAVKKLQNNSISTLELRFRKRSEELQLLFKRLNTQEYASKNLWYHMKLHFTFQFKLLIEQ